MLVARDERHKPRMVVDYYTLSDAYPLPNIDKQIAEIAKAAVFSTSDFTVNQRTTKFLCTPMTGRTRLSKPLENFINILASLLE